MANISSANGTIKLRGRWTKKALDMFVPILKVWKFSGEYGIHQCDIPTMKEKTVNFSGYGRWTFSDTLEMFDSWTREYLKKAENNKGGLPTENEYDEFLKLMAEKNLKIEFDFKDSESGVGMYNHVVGAFTSCDGRLNYTRLKCEAVLDDERGIKDAEYFFAQFLTDANMEELGEWIYENIYYTNVFSEWDIYDYDQIIFGLEDYDEDPFPQFSREFSPDTEKWEDFCSSYEGIKGCRPEEI